MRGKVAKALRRDARLRSEGKPAVAYVGREHRRENATTYVDGRGVEQKGTRRITSTEVRLDPNCTKGIYRQLKNQWKAGIYQPTTR